MADYGVQPYDLTPHITEVDTHRIPNIVHDYAYEELVSFSHLIGSITSIVVDYIRSVFNDSFFKTIWTTTEAPFYQRSTVFQDIVSKPRPMLVIDPKFDPMEDSDFIAHGEFDQYISNDPRSKFWTAFDSIPIIDTQNFLLAGKARRFKMNFSILMIFDSEAQKIKAQQYFRMKVRHSSPIVMYRYIENHIPRSFVKGMADITGLNINSKEFLRYVNTRTKSPITQRLYTGQGNNEFFTLQYTPINIKFNGPPSSNGPMKKGQIVLSSSLSDDFYVEFPAYSLYLLRTKTPISQEVYDSSGNISSTSKYDLTSTSVGVTLENPLEVEVPIVYKTENNFILINKFVVQSDNDGDDTVDLLCMVDDEVRNIQRDYFERDNNNMNIFKVVVYEGSYTRLDGNRYTFNQKNLSLTIKNMDKHLSYMIALYLDRNSVSEEMINLFESDKYTRVKGE